MKLIIHVGQPKTGSTSIQNLLKKNSNILRRAGFLFEANSLNHQPIIQKILNSKEQSDELDSFVQQQLSLAKKYNCHSIILSSEAFFEMEQNFLKQLLDKFNCQTSVIVYLKRQDLYLESIWKQWHFKNTHYADFTDFVTKFKLIDYDITLEKWSDLVGEQNISLIPFEKGEFENGLLINFLENLGVNEENTSDFDFEISKNMFGTNQGLSPKGLKFAFLARDLADGPLDYTLENFVHEYLSEVFHKDFFEGYGLFNVQSRKAFLGQFESSNNAIAMKYLKRSMLFNDALDLEQKDTEISIDDLARVVISMGVKFDKALKALQANRN